MVIIGIPAEGTVSADTAQAWLEVPNSDFGSTILSGEDYDRDGFPDLVVGAPRWDIDDGAAGTYGRFQIFRGGPTGF